MADFDPQLSPPAAPYYDPTLVVGDLIYAAYRKARALKHPGQGISPSESAEGLGLLNAMIDGWKIESLMIIYTRRTVQTMNAGQQVYGIGPGQDFDIERPSHIRRAGFIVTGQPPSNTAEIPMENILTFEQWAQFTVKATSSNVPLAYYYQAAAPNGAFTVWPVPNREGLIAIYTPQFLSEFATVDDAVEMPNGYRQMLEYNLAVAVHELYPEKPMSPSVENRADFYKSQVKANQLTPLFIGSDGGAIQNRGSGTYWGNPRAWTPYT